jgi:DNA ligase-1
MNSNAIHAAIGEIASTSSKLEKEALVKKYLLDNEFKRVCIAAYDPLTTYGIEQVPAWDKHGSSHFGASTWELLDGLAARSITGNDARQRLLFQLASLTRESGELLKRIIKKDLRAGFTEGTVNRVVPGTIAEFPYMRCSLPKDAKLHTWPWAQGVISQEKADGMYANVDHEEGGVVRITSRQGNALPVELLEELVGVIRTTLEPGTQTHGELLVEFQGDILPREQLNGILNALAQGRALEAGQRVVFVAWDQIPLSAVQPKGKYAVPYKTRFSRLAGQVAKTYSSCLCLIATLLVRSLAEAKEHNKALLKLGKEGSIISHPDGIWKDGTSKEKVKIKPSFEVDLRAKKFVPGTGKNEATFGSITFETSDSLLSVNVSGFTDAQRKKIAANKDDYLGQIGTVKANTIMAPSEDGKLYSLFSPRISAFPRKDKTLADTLQGVKDQFEAAVQVA